MNRKPDSHQSAAFLRRSFLQGSGYGVGAAAFETLLGATGRLAHAAPSIKAPPVFRGAMTAPHVPPRARRVIHLCMAGGPSQHETFDWKPQLKKLHGKPFPESFTKGQQLAQLQNAELRARGSFVGFKKWGKSGQEISELLPHIGSIADEICVVRSMHTEQINHDPAHAFMNAGSILKGRPSMGSWVMYGIGAETRTFPGLSFWCPREWAANSRCRRGNGRLVSCPANTREFSFSPGAMRSTMWEPRPAFPPRPRNVRSIRSI